MAIVLTSQLTNESLDPGSPSQFGSANAQASETVINLEGANCAAMGHSGTVGTASPVTADSQAANSNFRGMYVAVNIARDHNHAHFWVRDLYPIRNKSIGGVSAYLANNATQECLYYMTGIDDGYGGGWYHGVVNLSTVDRAAADLGTLPGANVNRLGYAGNISASKGEDFLQNSYLDAIRYGADGVGITFTGGTVGAKETMLACAEADANSYGLLRSLGGALFCEGCLTWGAATFTTHITDSLGAINFTAFTTGDGTTPVVAADYYQINFVDGTTGATFMNLTDWVWNGVSRALPFRFTTTAESNVFTRVTYIFGEVITLTQNTTNNFCSYVECQEIDPGGCWHIDCSFSNCDLFTLTNVNSKILRGSTSLHNTATNVGFVNCTVALDRIDGHAFSNSGGVGHAIDLGTIAATRTDSCNNTFFGYSTTVNGNKAVRVNVASGQTYTINVTGDGDLAANLVYNSGVGTLIVNAGAVSTSVNVKDQAGANIINARVVVETAAAGGEPYQDSISIIAFSGVATATHTGHGMATNDWMVIRGASPASYSKVAQITVTGANTYTYAVTTGIASPATGTPVASFVPLYGLTDASGNITASRTWSASQAVSGYARKSTVTPFYKTSNFGGTVSNTLGFSANITLLDDE